MFAVFYVTPHEVPVESDPFAIIATLEVFDLGVVLQSYSRARFWIS
jgi:hypothetical protein